MENNIKIYWDVRADSYSNSIKEELCSFKKEIWKDLISKYSGPGKNIKALDLGTGPGFFSILMGELGYEVTAVDCSDNMINEAKNNTTIAGVSVNFIKSDIENLDLPKESFDVIISRNLTWTLKKPSETYKKLYELLKKDGRLIIFDANWYRKLIDDKLKENCEKDLELAKSMGRKDIVTENQEKSCEDIARKLPLTYELRPYWDEEVLKDLGFRNTLINLDLNDQIYTEIEKVEYRHMPTFCICAFK